MKVYIRREMFGDGIDFAIYYERDGKRFFAKPVTFIFEEKKMGNTTEPTFSIPHEATPSFLKALAEALDKEGVKTENDFKIQGLLEAKSYHLEDMRKLVFKKRRN